MTNKKYEIIVIGAGHAGIEAALAAARLNCNVLILTMDISKIGVPSCNPSIGGTAKGHIVKEIDALGGAMGFLADKAGIHFKMLNKSKGPAVWSPRCQIDKYTYPIYAKQYIDFYHNIDIIEDTAVEIIIKNNKVSGVRTKADSIIDSQAIIFCPGTFLNGKMFTGNTISYGGRVGESPSELISNKLVEYGFEYGRLKTGTPPRIDKNSIDYSKVVAESGDDNFKPFSHKSKSISNIINCYLTSTNFNTHEILRTGFKDSPMFKGVIEGIGPRYCPSIEDKIARFSERDSHKIVLEPEGINSNSIYVNGFSTSLPLNIQIKGLKSIPGLENSIVTQAGYAIEYDYFPSFQLHYTLETKLVEGLYFAGQINGSSGYEEAAGQGLIAGANAALKILNKEPFSLNRSQAYIGVMIDDLVNKYSDEPYRLFTSLAEYRLLLRQDNAEYRLFNKAFSVGLIDEEYYHAILQNNEDVNRLENDIKQIKINYNILNKYFEEINESPTTGTMSIYDALKRSNTNLNELIKLADSDYDLDEEIIEQVQINTKYEGYIKRQLNEVKYFSENENKRIPDNFNYDKIKSLSEEARVKLQKIRPISFGQASRIPGVSATDLSIIAVYLK